MKKVIIIITFVLFIFNCDIVYSYKDYNAGEKVSYNNESYHVITNSDANTDYIVLLKDEALSHEDIVTYGGGEIITNNNEVNFHSGCSSNNIADGLCGFKDYNHSDIKYLLDNWSFILKKDLKYVDGYTVRLIKTSELKDNFNFDYVPNVTGEGYYELNDPEYSWLIDGFYWTMSSHENKDNTFYTMMNSKILYKYIYDSAKVKPVINLKKSALGDEDAETNMSDKNNQELSYNSYKIGEDIIYNNELYHVISDSSNNENYITLLKDKPLTVEEIDKYGRNSNGDIFIEKVEDTPDIYKFTDGSGGISYFYNNCIKYDDNGQKNFDYCSSNYNKSIIRRVVINWSKQYEKDLVKVDGYRSRLMNSSEFVNTNAFDWIENDNYKYWTMYPTNKKTVKTKPETSVNENIWDKNAIRPVINLNKCAIETNNPTCDIYKAEAKCNTKKYNMYKSFKVGDKIDYQGEQYHVIENSGNTTNYVTLLKDNPLSINDVQKFKETIMNNINLSNIDGQVSFNCNGEKCNEYNNSNIKKIVNNWVKNELSENDLIEVAGYKARLLKLEDFVNNFNFIEDVFSQEHTYTIYSATESTPPFIKQTSSGFEWTMSETDDDDIWVLKKDVNSLKPSNKDSYYSQGSVLPVINLKKDVLGSETNYNIGDLVTYKNSKYYVIENTDSSKNYIVLLKEKPLNNGQVILYQDDKMIFSTPYYVSETCNGGMNISGCTTNYSKSLIKEYIDEWSKNFQEDLIEVEGYKTRLISLNDLLYNLDYDRDRYYATSFVYCKSEDTPEWVYNEEYPYWTNEIYEDSNHQVYQNNTAGCLRVSIKNDDTDIIPYESSTIRPVINLNKCVLEGGCYETEICSNNETSVDVENTLKYISKILFIICGILIICGCTFIGYNYIISKKERKR